MKIGILQAGTSPDALRTTHGDYEDLFKRLLCARGFDFEIFRVLDGVFPKTVQDADGWLVTGSKHGVYDGLDWIATLKGFLRDVYAQGVPIVGICFGHQVLAQALGGRVEKFYGGWTVGATEYASGATDGRDRLLAWHQDQVVVPPPAAHVLGRFERCRYAILGYGNRALSVQPHPEFDVHFLIDLLAERGGVLPPDLRARALDGIGRPLTSMRFGDRIARFFVRDSANPAVLQDARKGVV